MVGLKVVIFLCLGSMILLLLASCQNHPVEISPEEPLKLNDTAQEAKNDSKTQISEQHTENITEDEGSKQDEILLPTVAPATPVSSSFILISSSEKMQSVLHTMQVENDHDASESSDEGKRPGIHSNVDEVEFDTDMHILNADNTKPNELPVISRKDSSGDVEKEDKLRRTEEGEPTIDIMEYEATGKVVSPVDDLEKKKHEPADSSSGIQEENVKLSGERDTGFSHPADEKVVDSSKGVETDTQDKGILESFKDWKEKQGTNGKKEFLEKTVIRTPLKKRGHKKTNYASSECGAKVVASNQEAENVAAILNENRDLYMLNPCSCSIWFVIELCEKVRAEMIEIANFELFSSAIENFTIYFSTRYPTRDWENGGAFQGKAERTVQSFNMAEEYYAKFVKIEIQSHFGKEHYCPLSLVRVFGRSEVEELDDSEEPSHEHESSSDETESNSIDSNEVSQSRQQQEGDGSKNKNFFKSATDMVIGFVNKATKTFATVDDDKNHTDGFNHGQEHFETKESKNESKVSNEDFSASSPKVVQIVDENSEELNASEVSLNGTEDSLNKSSETGASSSTNLVILLEGEDIEEESDNYQYIRQCIFHGEIRANRCANPVRKFWIKHLFTRQMCPLLLTEIVETHQKLLRNNTEKIEGKMNFESTSSGNTSSNVKPEQSEKVERINLFIATPTGEKNWSSSTEATSHSSTSLVKSVADDDDDDRKSESVDRTVFSPSKTEVKASNTEVTMTELMKREGGKVPGSCDKKVMEQPNLSQLLGEAMSITKELSWNEQNRYDTSVSGDKITTRNATKDSKEKDAEEKEKPENVDVLVINYDEQLKEGKAEVPTDIVEEKATISEKDAGIAKKMIEDSGKEAAKNKDVNEENIILNNEITDNYHNNEGEVDKAVSVEPLIEKNEEQFDAGKSELSEFMETSKICESVIEKKAEGTASSTFAAEELKTLIRDEPTPLTGEGMIMNMTSIQPSFSEPVTTGLGSQKTQTGIEIGTFQANITKPSIGTTPSPAFVSNSLLTSEHVTVSATHAPTQENVKQEVELSLDKNSGLSDSLSNSTEQFEMRKKEATETLNQLESSVKIGSGSSSNNKESAILKLKSRVKELEANLTLSTLYLEEMSKRYGTALEEQQKQFKAKISQLNQTVTENKETIERQQKSIEELTRQILILSLRLQNFTEEAREHNLKMAERYAFTCMVEAFIIIIVLYTCVRGPRQMQQPIEGRRHSAPSVYSHSINEGTRKVVQSRDENPVADQRPSNHNLSFNSESNMISSSYASLTKRKRQRKKVRSSDDPNFPELCQPGVNTTKEATMVSSTAGVLFSAGRGIFSGLTGAFSKEKKPIASRQTRALIDSTEYERVKSLGRSKSLSTIEEDDVILNPHRHQSYENIRSSRYKKNLRKFSDSEKRRG